LRANGRTLAGTGNAEQGECQQRGQKQVGQLAGHLMHQILTLLPTNDNQIIAG
jgi:hypothetical protein